jgi:hypothetical protein
LTTVLDVTDPGAPASTHPVSTTSGAEPPRKYERQNGTLALLASAMFIKVILHMALDKFSPACMLVPLNALNEQYMSFPSGTGGALGVLPWHASYTSKGHAYSV